MPRLTVDGSVPGKRLLSGQKKNLIAVLSHKSPLGSPHILGKKTRHPLYFHVLRSRSWGTEKYPFSRPQPNLRGGRVPLTPSVDTTVLRRSSPTTAQTDQWTTHFTPEKTSKKYDHRLPDSFSASVETGPGRDEGRDMGPVLTRPRRYCLLVFDPSNLVVSQ